mmetsp:Transcript_50036/g.143862  ORF Transcript_50036/g.143862 Transcript_50036/m.143862 type:complete len:576 (-) Transcript_50036:423-2150(-)
MASTTTPSLFASGGMSSEIRCRPHQRLLLKAGPSMNLKKLSGSHSQGVSCDQSVTNWRCCSTGWSPGCTQTDNNRKGEDRTWAPSADLDGLRKASSLGRQTKQSVTTPGRQTSASQSSGPRSRSCLASSQDSSLSPSESKPKTSLTTALAFTNRTSHCPSQAIAASAESAASKMRSASLPASVSRSSARVAAATARASRPVQAPRSQEQTPAAAGAVAAGAEADPFEEEGMASPPASERTGSEAFARALRKEAARASSSVSGQGDSTSMSNAYPGSWKKSFVDGLRGLIPERVQIVDRQCTSAESRETPAPTNRRGATGGCKGSRRAAVSRRGLHCRGGREAGCRQFGTQDGQRNEHGGSCQLRTAVVHRSFTHLVLPASRQSELLVRVDTIGRAVEELQMLRIAALHIQTLLGMPRPADATLRARRHDELHVGMSAILGAVKDLDDRTIFRLATPHVEALLGVGRPADHSPAAGRRIEALVRMVDALAAFPELHEVPVVRAAGFHVQAHLWLARPSDGHAPTPLTAAQHSVQRRPVRARRRHPIDTSGGLRAAGLGRRRRGEHLGGGLLQSHPP